MKGLNFKYEDKLPDFHAAMDITKERELAVYQCFSELYRSGKYEGYPMLIIEANKRFDFTPMEVFYFSFLLGSTAHRALTEFEAVINQFIDSVSKIDKDIENHLTSKN